VLEALPEIGRVTKVIRGHDRDLADQLRRAATSIALNLAEADGNAGGNRRNRLHTALGSLREVRAALRVAVAFEYVAAERVRDVTRCSIVLGR
jgi:four helix bundle protein